jgi:hypothetical protein
MSKYKDRYNNIVKIGDTVLHLISINMDKHSEPYTINVVRKEKNKLILDGVFGRTRLCDVKPEDICVMTPETNMRKVYCDFVDMQKYIYDCSRPELYNSYKYHPYAAYNHLEQIAVLMGYNKYKVNIKEIEDIISKIDLFFSDKEIDEEQVEKCLKVIKEFESSIINISNLTPSLYKIRSKKE